MNAYYALEDIKKRTLKYFVKLEENKEGEDPWDEQFLFKHFYQNKRGLIKQHLKEEKEENQQDRATALKKHILKYTMPFCHYTGHNLWLLKPTKLNRGRGIHVVNNLQTLKNLIAKYCEGFQKHIGNAAYAPPAKQMSLKIAEPELNNVSH